MDYLAASIVVLASILGVILTLLTLPGTWLAVATGLACAWWRPDMFGVWTLATCIALAVLGEVLEFFASAAGAASAKGTKAGAIGAIAGGLVGALVGTGASPIPIVGTVLGGIVGAGLGAALGERGMASRTWSESFRVAKGAAVGRALSIVLKGLLALVIGIVLSVAAFV